MGDVAAQADVLVAGGGNAAICATIEAASAGARVLVCEAAPRPLRGGDSRHTRNLRIAHDAPTPALAGAYREDEYLDDLLRVTAGNTDKGPARLAIRESAVLPAWMQAQGARFQRAFGGTLALARTNPFFLGGGKALLSACYLRAAALGVRIVYGCEVTGLEIEGGRFRAAHLRHRGFAARAEARAFIAAAGGFQANIGWLREAWRPAADNFLIRGTAYAKGAVLRALLDHGAAPVGAADQCHAVAIDARAPRFGGGIATRLDCVPFSIVVNRDGARFHDEGEDLWPKRYAIWGRLAAAQPGQIAFAILDAKAVPLFMPSIFPPELADTVEGLAAKLGLDPVRLAATVGRFNAACCGGDFDPAARDGCATSGLNPEKTNWARPIDAPPFVGYPLRPGITFTYLGVGVDATARVRMADGGRAANVWAAGEIMAGNILGQGYLAGIGMTIGTVFGRIAGREAAAHVRG